MNTTFSELSSIITSKSQHITLNTPIQHIITDSRRLSAPATTIFIAIQGVYHDGHKYIPQLINLGVKNFILEKSSSLAPYPDCNYIEVENSISALQSIAEFHRSLFPIPTIGITGSNGKTIVKEWLSSLLSTNNNVCKSPGSFNSQIGVPLSIFQLRTDHTIGVFEAGISQRGEMQKLAQIIKPTIGIFTNIGEAHSSGFESKQEKLAEKLLLFKTSEVIIHCIDQKDISKTNTKPSFTWGYSADADLRIESIVKNKLNLTYRKEKIRLSLPFSEEPHFENLMHCISAMVYLNIPFQEIEKRIQNISHLPMRLEVKDGVNNTILIDDSYNNDLEGLDKALQFQELQSQGMPKTIILSDIEQTAQSSSELYTAIASKLRQNSIHKTILVGTELSKQRHLFASATCYKDTSNFINNIELKNFNHECILVKGARSFGFERVVEKLEEKRHITRLEINLNALQHNYNYFRKLSSAKIMVMVKAFAYGAGNIEVAKLLQFLNVDYLGVAYIDEGIELRKNGISTPIMVMNPEFSNLEICSNHKLELEIFDQIGLRQVINSKYPISIHIKLDTGMKRLGFEAKDIEVLTKTLQENPQIKVKSIFSHLSSADIPAYDDFTQSQITAFNHAYDQLCNSLGYTPIKHILNSAGIQRFPEYCFDMIRLGIGLYGIGVNPQQQTHLEQIGTLKTKVSQIKSITKGESIGYARRGEATADMKIATIAIGYADGFDRRFSNGVGDVFINGKIYPIIGNVCMDMAMVDIGTDEIHSGDDVIIYGPELPIYTQSEKIGTIPYELLTHISERVKRVFYQE